MNFFAWYRLHKWAKANEHNTNLHRQIAVSLALGLIGVFLFALLAIGDTGDVARIAGKSSSGQDRQLVEALVWAAGVFALPGFGVIIWHVVRPLQGPAAIPTGECAVCKRNAPTTPVRFISVIGVFAWYYLAERAGFLCRSCLWRQFAIKTGTTLVLGWFSLFSLFITPGVVIHNVVLAIRGLVIGTRSSRYARKQAFDVLDKRRDYARAIVATKPSDVAIAVLEDVSGIPKAFVADYIEELRQPQRPRRIGPIR
jgi:hypothetical protein